MTDREILAKGMEFMSTDFFQEMDDEFKEVIINLVNALYAKV